MSTLVQDLGHPSDLVANMAERLAPGRPRHFYTLVHTLSRLAQCNSDRSFAPSEAGGVYFAHAASLCFEAQEVCGVQGAQPGLSAVFTVVSTFFGLTGTVSPLPQVLADSLIDEDIPKPLAHVFSSMHHRLMQLLVARYVQMHPPLSQRSGYDDTWSRRLLAWTPHVDNLSAALRWRYLRPLMRATPTAAELTGVVQDALAQRGIRAHLEVTPMTGGFVGLDSDQTCVLGRRQNGLGQSCVIGTHGWAPQSAFELDIYPSTPSDCRQIWREPDVQQEIWTLVRALGPLQTRCDVHLWVQPAMAPAVRLNGNSGLGQASWLGSPSQQVRLALHHAPSTRLAVA